MFARNNRAAIRPDTDPTESFPISSQTEIWWEEFCTTNTHYRLVNENDTAEPEDLDIDISGNELNFILTNTDALPLRVQLRNRGGHDADDYFAYVTFGDAMTVQSSPNACNEVEQSAGDAGLDRPGRPAAIGDGLPVRCRRGARQRQRATSTSRSSRIPECGRR